MDKLIEQTFIFVENLDISDMYAAIKTTLKSDTRHFLELTSVETTWMVGNYVWIADLEPLGPATCGDGLNLCHRRELQLGLRA